MQGLQRVGWTITCAALIAITALLLHAFAQRAFTAELRAQAAHALALAASGDTPYHWRFRSSEDIVAGRVFGADEFDIRADALIARSPGAAFEIGLPLSRAVDLSLFPHLQIAASAEGPASFDIVVRETLDAAELVLPGRAPMPGIAPQAIDLSVAQWTLADRPVAAPTRAAMLRLRVHMPIGERLHLSAVDLLRVPQARLDLSKSPQLVEPGAPADIAHTVVYRLPFRAELQSADLAAIARSATPQVPALIALPERGRVEQQIALRNAVFAALPGAILVPENDLDATFAAARDETAASAQPGQPVRWILLVIYAGALLRLRMRPPHAARVRAGVEVMLTMFGPLWLILFERFTGKPDAVQSGIIALSAAYALSLSFPRRWNWNGSARTWMLALGVVLFALLLGLMLHDNTAPLRSVSPSHSARYIAWALVQQYLICAICTERWQIVTGNRVGAAFLGALGFALLHTPNAALMIATFAGGLCWCTLYLRERALLPLAISHAASALLLLALLPRSLLASAEVSARFFQ